jgi:phenylacetate-coenzyme A ligase PaaK-like adenylate-forming protein
VKLAFSRKNLWERLPRSVKAASGSLLGAIPSPLLLGRHFRHTLGFLNEAEWWSAEQARAYQLGELRRILTLAFERTPFYRQSFSRMGFDPRDVRDIDDLRRLPTTDAATLRQHLHEMCAVSPRSPRVDSASTGGTGGAPLRFYIGSERSGIEYAYTVASWQRAGFRLGTPLAVLRGRPVPADRTGFRHEYDPLLRSHLYSNFHMADDDIRRYLEHVRGIGPCFLHVYPSSVAALARFVHRSGIQPPSNVLGILAGSENVYPDQRRFVEEVLGYRYFSWYGLTEKVALAAECEKSTLYHVWPTYGVFELLDEAGHPVTTPGQRGEIVGTGFINTVVPFIRYRTGDYATYVGDRCHDCGRAHPRIADIRGHRIQETLVAADGSAVTWTALNVHDDTFDHVRQFQFYQDTPGRAVLRLVPAPGFGERDRVRVLGALNRKLDRRLELTLQIVDAIALSRSGKSIYVDQRIPGVPAPEPTTNHRG